MYLEVLIRPVRPPTCASSKAQLSPLKLPVLEVLVIPTLEAFETVRFSMEVPLYGKLATFPSTPAPQVKVPAKTVAAWVPRLLRPRTVKAMVRLLRSFLGMDRGTGASGGLRAS
jgi:hypothetical protein